jgi:hypothetical protein
MILFYRGTIINIFVYGFRSQNCRCRLFVLEIFGVIKFIAGFWPTIQQLLVQWVDRGRQRQQIMAVDSEARGRCVPRPHPRRTARVSLESEIGVVGLGRGGKGAAGVKDRRNALRHDKWSLRYSTGRIRRWVRECVRGWQGDVGYWIGWIAGLLGGRDVWYSRVQLRGVSKGKSIVSSLEVCQ